MRRVLIVSPHFPPVNAPDHQRVRMSLPYLREFGWKAAVLAVKPEAIEGAVIDPLLERTYPAETEILRVGALSAKLTRPAGVGSLALRALPSLWRAGNRILGESKGSESKRVDLVFFSTTQFPVMILGPAWKRRFGVPYVVDFQDPWLDDYYRRTGTPAPGGKTKHQLSTALAQLLEPRVLRDVAQVIAVSPAYVETLALRYPYLRHEQFTVLSFAAAERDFEMLRTQQIDQSAFDPHDGNKHWVYVGRAGHDMGASLRLLFTALGFLRQKEPKKWAEVRLHFAGTNYAPAGRGKKTVEPIARQCGVADLVDERAGRIPYFAALKILRDADALVIIGSDSPSYSASKLYPYMFARKPMLAVLHCDSPGVKILRECRAGEIVTFDPESPQEQSAVLMAQALQRVYTMVDEQVVPEIDEQALGRYTAREMTRKQCEVFDRAVAVEGR